MPVKTNITTAAYLETITPPSTTGRESQIVSHKMVILKVRTELANAGYIIQSEAYVASANGYVMHARYFLTHQDDEDSDHIMSPVFLFTNNYEHSNEFCCSFGVDYENPKAIAIPGTLVRTPRKVKFTSVMAMERIEDEVRNSEVIQLGLIQDQITFLEKPATKETISNMIGALYIQENVLSVTQLSLIKKFIERFINSESSIGDVYQAVNEAVIEESHPRFVMDHLSKVHNYFVTILSPAVTPAPVVKSTPVTVATPVSEYVSPMPSVVFL